MLVKKLSLANLRGIEHAEFEFQPGMNLVVGVNGVGKTTVLDALRVLLSKLMPIISAFRSKEQFFTLNDIRNGKDFMTNSMVFEIFGKEFQFLLHNNRYEFSRANPDDHEKKVINTRNRQNIKPDISTLGKKLKVSTIQPIVLHFSTRRSLVSEAVVRSSDAEIGQAAAYASSLVNNRELNIRSIADRMSAQIDLAKDLPRVRRHLDLMYQVAASFLPEINGIKISQRERSTRNVLGKVRREVRNILLAIKGDEELEVNQLSDGERSMLALALEITLRLSQANPGLDNPVEEGEGVVLIDEIDLHLHPKWQRIITERLTSTFPKCQFIATTHSPQVIGEVDENQIILMSEGKVYRPNIAFGVDSSRILEEIMDTDSRNAKIKKMLNKLFELIDAEDLSSAKAELVQLRELIGSNDPEVIRAQTLIDFLED